MIERIKFVIYFDGLGIFEFPFSRNEFDFSLLAKLSETRGHFIDDLVLAVTNGIKIDFGFSKVDAPGFYLLGFIY